MPKYTPLEAYLENQRLAEVSMTFANVERVLGAPLPRSAFEHRPWWANETHGHVHAKAWLNAGYETAQVDMEGRKLVFRRIKQDGPHSPPHAAHPHVGMEEPARSFKPDDSKKPYRSPLWGAMKGTFTLVPPDGTEQPPDDPESWEALALAKFDRLLFGKGE